jgi:[NiFe] hydrogenase diaphorase moiety large subunit
MASGTAEIRHATSSSSSAGDAGATAVVDIVQEFGGDRARLMDIIQAVQSRYGTISDAGASAIAAALGIHSVEVEDTVSFYHFFNREPKGRFHIRFSRTPVSLLNGAAEVVRAFSEATGAPIGDTSPDGMFTLEWTSDIGMADQEPAALINGTVVTNLSSADAPAIVAELRQSGESATIQLFPGIGGKGSALPQARVRQSLVQPGPVLFRQGGRRGDGVRVALTRDPDAVITEISRSKLRGRGGAGFPTGLKWKLCRQSAGEERHVVCNADEGEPGTFKDRVLLAQAPDLVFDGMTIAGYALGARHGLVYLRAEYAYMWDALQRALEQRRRLGLLGTSVCGREDFPFDIRIQLGAGAYVCGEESALIESLEGKRGWPRERPPFPTERGYRQQPTAVDNVETFACAARILEESAAWFVGYGTPESTGTKLLSISGDCPRPGAYEVPFGITLNELLDLVGAPEAESVQVGGPSGQCVAPKDFGRRIAYEDLSTGGSVMVFGPGRDPLEIALQFAEFFVDESCGQCVPCRVGTTLLKKSLEKIIANRATLADIAATEALANTVSRMSRCGLGQTAPNPILSTMRNFPHLYEKRLQPHLFEPRVTLRESLADAVAIQKREPTDDAAAADD